MTSSLELKLRLYVVFGQAAPAAAGPQWALSSRRVGWAALPGAPGLELPPGWAARLSDRC